MRENGYYWVRFKETPSGNPGEWTVARYNDDGTAGIWDAVASDEIYTDEDIAVVGARIPTPEVSNHE